MDARKFTNRVIDLMYDGVLEPRWLVEALASWHSEDAMQEFYNVYIADNSEDDIEEEDEDEEEEDNE